MSDTQAPNAQFLIVVFNPIGDSIIRFIIGVTTLLPGTLPLAASEESFDQSILLRRIWPDVFLLQILLPHCVMKPFRAEHQTGIRSQSQSNSIGTYPLPKQSLFERSNGYTCFPRLRASPANPIPITAIDYRNQMTPTILFGKTMRHIDGPSHYHRNSPPPVLRILFDDPAGLFHSHRFSSCGSSAGPSDGNTASNDAGLRSYKAFSSSNKSPLHAIRSAGSEFRLFPAPQSFGFFSYGILHIQLPDCCFQLFDLAISLFSPCSPAFRKVSTHSWASLGVRSFCLATSTIVLVCLRICRMISAFLVASHLCWSPMFPLLVQYTCSELFGGHYMAGLCALFGTTFSLYPKTLRILSSKMLFPTPRCSPKLPFRTAFKRKSIRTLARTSVNFLYHIR